MFEQGIKKSRDTHTPALFHVEEVTQPQGHSTSGSHERYKTPERLEWERQWDCIKKFREWIIQNTLASDEELSEIEREAKEFVRDSKNSAWDKYLSPIKDQVNTVLQHTNNIIASGADTEGRIEKLAKELSANREPQRRDVMKTIAMVLDETDNSVLKQYYQSLVAQNNALYNSCLYLNGSRSAMKVEEVKATYASDAPLINGYEILNRYFDNLFASNPKVMAFGEDLGFIGDVNQGFAGLQAKHGEGRIFDTGIRELTIMGQGIGLALRGLRPIAEIQYLDYLVYGLQPLTDDAATLHFRTVGVQSAPIIVRTRGHRLEGIWHSGSPMGMIINSLRGMYVCVPRNMVQAAGMYNTLLKGNEPALVIECLNGYRLKEKLPSNLNEFTVPMGVPEVIREGNDVTIVSYGSTLRIIQEAANRLENLGIQCEVIDVQTLIPFAIHHIIFQSLQKTTRMVFVDEDVLGGAAGYMFNKVMEEQGGYKWLDVAPRTITGQAHRPAYGSDGDYFSKPNAEDIVRVVKEMMAE